MTACATTDLIEQQDFPKTAENTRLAAGSVINSLSQRRPQTTGAWRIDRRAAGFTCGRKRKQGPGLAAMHLDHRAVHGVDTGADRERDMICSISSTPLKLQKRDQRA